MFLLNGNEWMCYINIMIFLGEDLSTTSLPNTSLTDVIDNKEAIEDNLVQDILVFKTGTFLDNTEVRVQTK